jgi:hypothetical protein
MPIAQSIHLNTSIILYLYVKYKTDIIEW